MTNLKVSLENIIPLTEARDHFSQIVTEVQQDKLYVLTKGGKPAVAIIDVKYLESVTGGTVKPEHIETEIQKDPAKVGRVPMIKHDTVNQAVNQTTSEPSSLVFPKIDAPAEQSPFGNSTGTNLPNTKSSGPAPIKINFQPAGQSPSPLGATNTPPPTISTPLTTTTPPPTPPVSIPPAPGPVSANPPAPAPTPVPITPPVSPAPSATPGALSTNPLPTQTNMPANNTGSTIDMIPTPEETVTSTTSTLAQDDKPGPAQYAGAGENNNEPQDMEI